MNILTTNSTGSCLFTFVRKGTMYEISTACFIYRSIFAVQALRKRRVQGHCAAYHFRIVDIGWITGQTQIAGYIGQTLLSVTVARSDWFYYCIIVYTIESIPVDSDHYFNC